MNRDKQINDLAEEIREIKEYITDIDGTTYGERYVTVSHSERIAKHLLDAGYRKASDVAREAIDELERRLYSVSHRETSITGYSYSVVDIDEIAYEVEELKKKYESEGEG